MLHHTSAGVWPGFASVSLTAQVIMEVFVLYSTDRVQSVQQPHPCQLIQAPSSPCLTRPQYLWMTQSLHLASVLCSHCTAVQCSTRPPSWAQYTVQAEAAAVTTYTHTINILLRSCVIISDKNSYYQYRLCLSPCDNISDSCTMSGAVLLPHTIYWSWPAQPGAWLPEPELLSVHQAAGPSS